MMARPWSKRVYERNVALLYELQGGVCAGCGEPIDLTLRRGHKRGASLDHVYPKMRGGSHGLLNLLLKHASPCNSRKGAQPPSFSDLEWLARLRPLILAWQAQRMRENHERQQAERPKDPGPKRRNGDGYSVESARYRAWAEQHRREVEHEA